jgi:hypothetical protein
LAKSGIEVSDLYPNLGKCIDDIAVIRSTYADSFAHGSGLLQMNTGFVRQGYPSMGSWVSYGLGTENQNLPAFVVLLDHRGGPISGAPNWGSGIHASDLPRNPVPNDGRSNPLSWIPRRSHSLRSSGNNWI